MAKLPLISVIIPTYNRPERLAQCIKAIAKQDYPGEHFEVIVVDDGSKISLDAVVAPIQAQINLQLLRQSNAGPATARNNGAAKAQGEFIVFTDDDCQPTPNWLSSIAQQLQANPKAMIGGRTINALSDNIFSTASQALIDYLYEYYNPQLTQAAFFASNNIAMPTAGFRQLGGFDAAFPLAAAEDRDFCDRWQQQGYPMVYAPEVTIKHFHHLNLSSFWRQHFGYGRGAFCFHQLRSRRTKQSIKVEPLAFYYNLLSYPFRQAASQQKIYVSALFLLSQIANVSGFFWESFNQKTAKIS